MKCSEKYGSAAAIALSSGLALAGMTTSTFDTDTEGWSTLNDARDFEWIGTEGQPAGAVTARDRGTGAIWYYAASAAYLGDRSAAAGGEINWDIRGITGNQTSIPGRADVMLEGAGLTIGITDAVQPQLDMWVSGSVSLQASAGWEIVGSTSNGSLNGTAVTDMQFAAVLADLTGLFIRGEYTNGSDRTALDNVELVPAPGAAAGLLALGLVSARRRRG